jgi:hypothetical protein
MILAVGLALLLCLCIEMPFSAITTVFILPGKFISDFTDGIHI